MPVIGLDLGGTKLAGAIFSDEGEILHRTLSPLEGRTGGDVGRLIVDQLGGLSGWARERGHALRAAAASVPGIAHQRDGTVWAPNIPGWDRFPLRALIEGELGGGIAVAVDSDRACSILGEMASGAARGSANAIFLAVGTGIGAGILVEGTILRGAHDISGAIGWMALDRPYRAQYDACGCFETHASGAGIERKARQRLAATPGHEGPLGELDPSRVTTADVFDAYDRGDTIAGAVIDDAIECWGMAVANLVSLFNPEVVILGGGVFGPAARFLGRIEAEARRWAQPIAIGRVALRASVLGPDACLHGTGRLALSLPGPHS
jgi:glucokinase